MPHARTCAGGWAIPSRQTLRTSVRSRSPGKGPSAGFSSDGWPRRPTEPPLMRDFLRFQLGRMSISTSPVRLVDEGPVNFELIQRLAGETHANHHELVRYI